jgi:hypothetical protein
MKGFRGELAGVAVGEGGEVAVFRYKYDYFESKRMSIIPTSFK